MALRPCDNASSINSRYGSQVLAEEQQNGGGEAGAILSDSAPKSVITSLAGFAGASRPQPLGGRTAIPAARR